jgi:hypothetical protein
MDTFSRHASYLQTNEWNLETALQEALADAVWEEQERQREQEAAAVARAATRQEASVFALESPGDKLEESESDCLSGVFSVVRVWLCPKRSSGLELTAP